MKSEQEEKRKDSPPDQENENSGGEKSLGGGWVLSSEATGKMRRWSDLMEVLLAVASRHAHSSYRRGRRDTRRTDTEGVHMIIHQEGAFAFMLSEVLI
jgi:hypothetical protein